MWNLEEESCSNLPEDSPSLLRKAIKNFLNAGSIPDVLLSSFLIDNKFWSMYFWENIEVSWTFFFFYSNPAETVVDEEYR